MTNLQSSCSNLHLNLIFISFFVNYCNSSPKLFLIQTEDKNDAVKAKAKIKRKKKKAKGGQAKAKSRKKIAKDPVYLGKGGADYIVGGQEAVPHQFPWQITLFQNNRHICGATIVDSTHVLSAAHCIQGRQNSWIKVVAGAHNIYANPPEASIQRRNVLQMWTHEGYVYNVWRKILINDVCLLKLDAPLEFNEYVQPLAMAPKGDDPAQGTICVSSGWGNVLGWGSTSRWNHQSMPSKLQYVEMPIVSRPKCKVDYSAFYPVTEGMICAGAVGNSPFGKGISICGGDSGGALACPNENGTQQLSGIVSWVLRPCGTPNRPSVYARVGHFRDWIDRHLAL